jgi:hypothetical protein
MLFLCISYDAFLAFLAGVLCNMVTGRLWERAEHCFFGVHVSRPLVVLVSVLNA